MPFNHQLLQSTYDLDDQTHYNPDHLELSMTSCTGVANQQSRNNTENCETVLGGMDEFVVGRAS
jgi:hypothetical protein